MNSIEMVTEMINNWEQKQQKVAQLISIIQMHADLFEMRTRYEPTVFMSYDLFALIAAVNRDAIGKEVLLTRLDENKPAHTICGYDLELIQPGSNLLYVGYKVDMSGFIAEVYNYNE